MLQFSVFKALASLVLIANWSIRARAVIERSAKFVLVRSGAIPIWGVWPLETVETTTAIGCANKCGNHDDSTGCGGFLFQAETCGSNKLQLHGTCQLMQFFDVALVLFGQADPGCWKFFASTSPVTPILQNMALHHPSYQINDYATATANFANDGNNETSSCTNLVLHPWWAVDLSQPANVQVVEVTNDGNTYYEYRMNNFMVGLANVQPTVGQPLAAGVDYTVCKQFNGSVLAGDTVDVFCPPSSSKYRYVVIQGMLAGADSICIREVKVY